MGQLNVLLATNIVHTFKSAWSQHTVCTLDVSPHMRHLHDAFMAVQGVELKLCRVRLCEGTIRRRLALKGRGRQRNSNSRRVALWIAALH